MKKLASMFKASFEELENPELLQEVTPEYIDESNAGVDTLVEEHAEIDGEHEEIDKAEELADQLEESVTIAQESLRAGTMTPGEYRMFAVNANHFLGAVGLESLPVASVEALGDINATAAASLESMVENLKKFWDFIRKALKAAWEKLKGFFMRAFDEIAKLKNRARAVAKASSKGTAKGEFTVSGVASVSFDGKADFASIGKGIDSSAAVYAETAKLASDVFDSGGLKSAVAVDAEKAIATFSEIKLTGATKLAGQKVIKVENGTFVIESDGTAGSATIPHPSTAEANAIGAKVAVFCDKVLTSKGLVTGLAKRADEFVGALSATATPENQEKLKKFYDAVKKVQQSRVNGLGKVLAAGASSSRTALTNAERVLKAHDKAAAPKASDKKGS